MKKLLSVAALLMIALLFFSGCAKDADPNALPGVWATSVELNTSPHSFWLNKGNLTYNNENKTFVYNCNAGELTGDYAPGNNRFNTHLHLLTTDSNYTGFKATVSSSADAYYGFVFNCTYSGSTWSYYLIYVHNNKFFIQKMINEELTDITPSWTVNTAINDSSTENEVLVYKDNDSSIVIKFNGETIYTITNPQISLGKIGVACCVSGSDCAANTAVTTNWKFTGFQN